jgi:hypothetical protein
MQARIGESAVYAKVLHLGFDAAQRPRMMQVGLFLLGGRFTVKLLLFVFFVFH